ncbi:sensor histidine kinase [Dyadobacter psychrotolerans]|uniref:Histidine kinase n=1 Tax=Dyadobacter psychrotolerans TaxID=2541721 RepID=A0A4R5DS59_9BACT|nr:histidine kinase [Dyadobacter psychrotolerans]TDE17169.1 histidine kinase [Dyadobacter psychrotolerans]
MKYTRQRLLTGGKSKWLLALGIVLIYLPIRIYVSNPEFTWAIFTSKLPLWLVEWLVNVVFFRLWISIIDYIQILSNRINQKIKIKPVTQLITFITGVVLAVAFNTAFVFLWLNMASFYSRHFNVDLFANRMYPQSVGQFRKVNGDTEKVIRLISERSRSQRSKSNTALTIMAMLATFYLVSNRRMLESMAQIRVDAERLETEHMHAQLIVLKNQLSPHFLFNSLSILTSLIETDAARSILFVGRLSKSYRYILDQSGAETVKLGAELDFLDTYVYLLKARFEEKLNVIIHIPESYKYQYSIAPLTLQLLIENAVKHNQMSEQDPLTVTICAELTFLIVSNPIRLRSKTGNSPAIGLDNIIKRYQLLSASPVIIEKTESDFVVKIPLLS